MGLSDKDIDRVAARMLILADARRKQQVVADVAEKVRDRERQARLTRQITREERNRINPVTDKPWINPDYLFGFIKAEPRTVSALCAAIFADVTTDTLAAISGALRVLLQAHRIEGRTRMDGVTIWHAKEQGAPVGLKDPDINDLRQAVVDAARTIPVRDVVNELERVTGHKKASDVWPGHYRDAIDALANMIAAQQTREQAVSDGVEALIENPEDIIRNDIARQGTQRAERLDFLDDPDAVFAVPTPEHQHLKPLRDEMDFDFGCCRAYWVATRTPGRGYYVIVHRPDNRRLGTMSQILGPKIRRMIHNIEEQALNFKRRMIRNKKNAADYAELERVAENRAKHLGAAETAVREAQIELTACNAAMKQLMDRIEAYEDDEALSAANERLSGDLLAAQRDLKELRANYRTLEGLFATKAQEVLNLAAEQASLMKELTQLTSERDQAELDGYSHN